MARRDQRKRLKRLAARLLDEVRELEAALVEEVEAHRQDLQRWAARFEEFGQRLQALEQSHYAAVAGRLLAESAAAN